MALFVVVGGIVAARVMHLDERGVALLGVVPQGLPMPTLPAVTRADLHEILPLAMACFMLAAVETTAIGRMFAAKHGYRLDATQEFLALGGCQPRRGGRHRVAGQRRHVPVAGQRNRRRPNPAFRASSSALIMLVVVVFFTGLLRTLPQPVLAAVVLMAVTGLIQVETLRTTWRFSRAEFADAMAALLGVLAAGLLQGVLIGVAISILLLIRRAENPREPGVLVVRPEGSIVYFNVDHVRDALSALLKMRPDPPQLVILFMGNVPHVDLAGAELLIALRRNCLGRGIEFRLAELTGPFAKRCSASTGPTRAPSPRRIRPWTTSSTSGFTSRRERVQFAVRSGSGWARGSAAGLSGRRPSAICSVCDGIAITVPAASTPSMMRSSSSCWTSRNPSPSRVKT